ncbi:MAG: ACP S-malonyltransferase [Bdellovibrionales bacterium]|nr:ACP S-malonyltransferase [Bdellovibrionales bacterium]
MLALGFPGQGSQFVGMAKFLIDDFDIAKQTIEEASDTLQINFKKLLLEGPEEELNKTENTQPALVIASTIYYRVIHEIVGLPPLPAFGHSLGEYSALVANEALSFSSALRLTKSRGQFMQEAVPVGKGAMLAVLGVEDKDVEKICAWASEQTGKVIEPANFNSPGQVVVSGDVIACNFLRENFKEDLIGKKAKFIPLKVSAPFHCSLMKPAQDKMQALLEAENIATAKAPIVQNFDAKAHTNPDEIRQNLIYQITGSVRWTESVISMKQMGIRLFLELGPGKVLSGLVKKIDSNELTTFNMQNLDDIKILEQNWKDFLGGSFKG